MCRAQRDGRVNTHTHILKSIDDFRCYVQIRRNKTWSLCARARGLYDTAFFHVYEHGSRASAVSHAPFKRVLFISNNNDNKKKKTKSTTNFSYHVLAINKRRACHDGGNAAVAPFSKTNVDDVLFKQQKTNPSCCTYDSGQTGVPFFSSSFIYTYGFLFWPKYYGNYRATVPFPFVRVTPSGDIHMHTSTKRTIITTSCTKRKSGLYL